MQSRDEQVHKLERTIQWMVLDRTKLMVRIAHLESERDAAIWLRDNDVSETVASVLMADLSDQRHESDRLHDDKCRKDGSCGVGPSVPEVNEGGGGDADSDGLDGDE